MRLISRKFRQAINAISTNASGLTAIINVDSAAERLISRRAWASSTGCTS
ncbi:Uncharacterised protein [Citrobacter koseri]|nr:Uncharacterised protein [Citrobacter koseri]